MMSADEEGGKRTYRARLAFVPPCLARASAVPPSGDDWVHEIKFDGYRVQAQVVDGHVRLLTRSGLDWTARFGTRLRDALSGLDARIVSLDCEAIVTDGDGVSSFHALQGELKKGDEAAIRLMVFDLLHLDGADLCPLPLLDRKAALKRLLGNTGAAAPVQYSEHMTGNGDEILKSACRMRLEGIVSKRIDLPYRSGRNGDWAKTKCVRADPFVVIGYTASKGPSESVGALVLGYYDDGALVYAGRVGTGFTLAEAAAMWQALKFIRTRTPPLARSLTRLQRDGVIWVRPQLVAEVEYRAWTADNILRHASFAHFREDKTPDEIGRPAAW